MTRYQSQVQDILENAEGYHSKYYKAEKFSGPCLYFHRKSIECQQLSDYNRYLEYIYATLTSWGMHRMGRGGGKMVGFDDFRQSIDPLWDQIKRARAIEYDCVTDSDWETLEQIFKGIKVMATGTSLVGNSKVMAHMVPNIVPPIDREYTLRFLLGNTNIQNSLDREWKLMRELIREFFIPVAKDSNFIGLAREWISDQIKYPWDTSIFKIIDNLVIGAG